MKKILFIFHRDLRLFDNTTLLHVLNSSNDSIVYPIFIFPPEQIDPQKNPYFSNNAVQFMCESLEDLDKSIRQYGKNRAKLHLFKGDNIQVLEAIYKAVNGDIDAVCFNEDYSVYARHRDREIADWCKNKEIQCITMEDYLLFPMNSGLLGDGRPYVVLSQFYNRYLKSLEVRKPSGDIKTFVKIAPINGSDKIQGNIDISIINKFYDKNDTIAMKGGRTEALKRIQFILPKLTKTYGEKRDYPEDEDGTTRISAHLKFGTISIREFYWECVKIFKTRDHPLIRELMFRELYTKVYSLRPKLQRGEAFLKHLDENVDWSMNKKYWDAWVSGTTGYPIVDAGMRQLIATGYTHNRVRMIQGSFATRYLGMDWRKCAQYYATNLVDVCPYVNIASWQWCAGVGCDAMYYRAPFNPFIQSKKFDKDCTYIKKWIPELKEVDPKDIHNWHDKRVRSKYGNINYPEPIVDQKEASKRSVELFKKAAASVK